jgi:phenylalanyl-tRNA synthetase alpha chain
MAAEEISKKAGIPASSVLSFSQSLKEKGYASVEVVEEKKLLLTPEGQSYLENGLPEQSVHKKALSGALLHSLSPTERSVGLAWASRNGWVKAESGALRSLCEPEAYHLHSALASISEGKEVGEADLSALLKRKLAVQISAKSVYLSPTAVQPEEISGGENAITRQMLLSGAYKGASFRPYDVSAPAELPLVAKRHAISRLQLRIGRIFSELGFQEMEGPQVQSAFWNFDALFQPQDHPARELADTFYLKGASSLPDDASLLSRVKKVHEKSWGGQWSDQIAKKKVLRTHTTAVSASYLYSECRDGKPKKYFSIGKVYRNEATDYKHLSEFFQVEGIVVWEGATFCDLLGLLREFYKKLGFEKIRFQPSYFPYTEPSLEVSVYFEKKKQWLELGGAGIFRPEVSIPLCDRYPVLAWGLSLERPLMLLSDMDDIRDFYRGNAGWLRRQKVE